MPALIPIALAAGLAAAEIITWAAFWLTVASVAVGQWQAANARRAARDAFNASLRDRLVSVATTTAMRSRVYGRVRNVDGVLYKATHGPDNRYYTFVVAVAGHEVDAIETVYFNDTALTIDAGTGAVQTAPFAQPDPVGYSASVTISGGVGSVTLPLTPKPGSLAGSIPSGGVGADATFAQLTVTSVVGNTVNLSAPVDGVATLFYMSTGTVPLAHVFAFTGAPGQDISGNLIGLGVPGIVSGVHRFAGIALLIVRLTYDLEAYSTGVPQFSAVMRGAKCFDRRTSTTAFTENPAVIGDDWSQYPYGGALASTEIDGPLIIASANANDVPHTFVYDTTGGDAPGTSTQAMYKCGIVCKTDADPADNLASIVESMAGQWGWAGGKLRIKGGFYTAPVLTIDETWFAPGARNLSASIPQGDIVNVYNAQIAAAGFNYTVVPVAPVRADAYITADGREYPRSLVLEGVTDQLHAQHVLGVMLRSARQGFTASFPLNFKGLHLELFDTVAVTLDRYGLTSKAMDVVEWGFTQEGGTTVVLKETAASIFDPDAGFTLVDASPNTNLPLPWVVQQITGLTVISGTALLSDRSIVTRTLVSWDAIADISVLQSGKIEVQFMDLGTIPAAWQTIEENGDATQTIISGLQAGHFYQFRVRGRTTLGVRGQFSSVVVAEIAPSYFDGVLDATKDLTLIGRGQCVVNGNTVTKVGGTSAWDSDAYSKEFAYGACSASIIVGTLAEMNFMFGLNSDPTTNSSYTSLDYSMHLTSTGFFGCYENGVFVSTAFALAPGDAMQILYDGSVVRYLQNGVTRRVTAAPPGLVLFFDSSFLEPGATMRSIRFSPLSANNWASIGGVDVTTGQLHSEAATVVRPADLATDTVNIPNSSGVFAGFHLTTSYTNDTGHSMQMDITSSSTRTLTGSSGASMGAKSHMEIAVNGGTSLLAGQTSMPGTVVGSAAQLWGDAFTKTLVMAPGNSITVKLGYIIQGTFGSASTLLTQNAHLRLTGMLR